MSTEIKVYLTNEQIDDNLCFHAIVHSKNDYDLFFDLNETYEPLMVEALNGDFSLEYQNKGSYDKHTFDIGSEDYEDNLNSFIVFLNEFYGVTARLETTSFYAHFGIRLIGIGFRGNQNNPMLETAEFNARNIMHSIKTQLFSTNNMDYNGSDDIYIKKAHGSLKLILEATKRYEEPIDFIRSIYNDIENKQIDPFKFDTKEQQYRYQTIIKNLNDLNSQKKLQEFYVIIDGQEFEITKRTYLKEQSKNIYNETVELIGVFEAYKQRSDSFEIYSEGIGKFYCHLKSLSQNDFSKYEQVINILKDLDSFSTTKIKIFGNKIKPQTINITNVELY